MYPLRLSIYMRAVAKLGASRPASARAPVVLDEEQRCGPFLVLPRAAQRASLSESVLLGRRHWLVGPGPRAHP